MKRHPLLCLRTMSGSRLPSLIVDETLTRTMMSLTEMTQACADQAGGIENDWATLIGDNGVRPESIYCPTLIVHDRQDPLVPFIHAEWSHAAIAGSQLLDVSAGGHLIWFGQDSANMKHTRDEFFRTHCVR